MATEANKIPLTQFAYRSVKSLKVVENDASTNTMCKISSYKGLDNIEARNLIYDKNGRHLAYITSTKLVVVDAETKEELLNKDHKDIHDIDISPNGTYLSTWQRAGKNEDGSPTPNLFIYEVKTGEIKAQLVQKLHGNWKPQWTSDESIMVRIVTNEVHFFTANKLDKNPTYKLKLNGVSTFQLSPGKSPHVAAFVPVAKTGAPASVKLYSIPSFTSPVASKNFFKADKIDMYWNDLGTGLLALTSTETDKTGKSYYGETNLYYLATAGNFDCRVGLDKEGPIHDLTWSPTSKEFAVCYGFMPAKTTVFNHRAAPLFNFGEIPRNFVRFNPQGTHFLLAGFGNLNGALDIYDCNGYKKLTNLDASGSVFCEWLPDGRHILTATLSPRLRVDNGIKLWHRSGALVHEERHDNLYQVQVRPQNPNLFKTKSKLPSPPPTAIKTEAPKKPAGAYVPPHLRNKPESTKSTNKANNNTKKNGNVGNKDKELEQTQKKVDQLKKKLKEINQLMEQVTTSDTKLTKEEVKKINTKQDVLFELEQLNSLLKRLKI